MRTVILLLIFLAGLAQAGTEPAAPLQLAVPSGFEGPVHENRGPVQAEAYVRPIAGRQRGTLLQITRVDLGTQLKDLPQARRASLAGHYLLQFLGGIERRRTGFKASTPTDIVLDSRPAVRVEWTGSAQDQSMWGLMYAVFAGDVLVVLHTQTFNDAPPQDMADARQAIESIRFRQQD